jgi:PST family polysaccharide transporter
MDGSDRGVPIRGEPVGRESNRNGIARTTEHALAFVYAAYLFRYLYLLLLIPFYGRVLGVDDYGRLLAAMSIYQVVWLLCEYGFPLVGARDVAATGCAATHARLYGQHVAGRLMLVVPCLFVGGFATCLSPLLRESPVLGLLATLAGIVAAMNLGWYFQGTLRFRTSVALEVAGFAINLPLILLLVTGPGDSWIVMTILLGSSALCALAAHGIVLRSLDTAAIQLSGALILVRQATAQFVHKASTVLPGSATTFVLSLFSSPSEVGFYGAAERLASAVLSLLQPANQVLVGVISRRLGSRSTADSAYRLMRASLIVTVVAGILLLIATYTTADALVPWILGPDFRASVPMMVTLSLMYPFAGFSQVVSAQILTPLRDDTRVWRASVLGAVLTLALLLPLAWILDGLGAAMARSAGAVGLAGMFLIALTGSGLITRIRSV